MPQWENKENYERWKTEKLKAAKESKVEASAPQNSTEPQKPVKMTKLDKLIKKVSEHLEEDESIVASIMGTYETTIMGKEWIRNGIFLATNKRVVFYAKKLTGYDLEVFPYTNISSIEMSKGLMGYKVSLFAAGNKVDMKWINEGYIQSFVSYVKHNIGKQPPSESVNNTTPDIPKQIKKLAELKDQGILTEEEFQEKKKLLLSKIS